MILRQIYNKISAAARIAGGVKAVWYTIPELIPGTPHFDMNDAVLYLVWNLRNAGYQVDYTWPNGLYISWQAHDEYYRHVESPWMQVLESTRKAVLTGEVRPTTISLAKPAPAFTTATPADVIKRKSVLKKTEEYRPTATVPTATNPSVLSAMYGSAAAISAPPRLPGQLSEKHVSFV